ncbi:MAG: metallopeptidase family protein [Dehalococcoidia bacterium]|nr:metallopeptidase family protein [Dehalococcoidia bacterium]
MDRDRFRRLVLRALATLPAEFSRRLSNLEVVVRREPTATDLEAAGLEHGETLFGLYVGTPLTARADYHMTLPDRIVIFQGPLQRHTHPRSIPDEVRATVVHELAHHFGIDDERLRALGRD